VTRHELRHTDPGEIASSYASRVIVTQLAQEHAADNHAAMSSADIPALLHAAPEAHLMQLLRSEPYTFGDKVSPNEITKIGVKKVREYIHRAITTPAGAKKLGPAVIKAYLRFNPFP